MKTGPVYGMVAIRCFVEQHCSLQDDLEHIRSLIPYFKDRRYIRVNKPVIAIYRSTLLPDARSTIHTWRSEAAKHGFDLYMSF